jgi:hypothetical protein
MEEIDSKFERNQNISSMSERQAILYLEKTGANLNNNPKSEPRNIILDYHKYYLFKKKHHEQQISKEKLEYRKNLYQMSLKEYTPIKKSIYMDRKKNANFTDDDEFQCHCRPNKFTQTEVDEILRTHYKDKTEDELFGCGKCMNKIIFTECDENCPCGVSCRNRRFQNHEYAEVYPIKTEDRGWGLCAGAFLPKDTFIMQYIGEIYSLNSEYGEKKMKEYKDKTCTYLMGLPNNNRHEVIDPTKSGNMARFINHSCDPNCETRKWHVKGELCIGIFAKKDIQEDEELTFNYDFDLNKTRYQKCLCGAKNCRGYLGISTEENKKKLNKNLSCSLCKEICKHNESIIDCKTCGKFFHKKCAKKKGQLSSNNEYKCSHCLKKNLTSNDIFSKKDDILKEKIKLDEEPIYDEIFEVGDEDLQKIKKNLGDLINIGAGLFWDFQSENAILGTTNKIDLKISGTTKQIEGVKEAIKTLKSKKEEGLNEYTVKLNVPKIYIRKIIGHQHRNLDSYKSKFGVQIIYDSTLITDEIFSIQDSTSIEIKGKESNVKAVVLNIKKYLYNLKVISIYLLQEDYFYLRQNICSLKTSVDPADLRLRKFDIKNEREIKHPFYYISNNIKDIVIIGFENEIEKAKNVIKNTLLRQNNISFNYSLSFLFPVYFKSRLSEFILENKNEIENNKIKIDSMDPEYLRRHISVTISGRWNSIVNIKSKLWNYLKSYAIEGVPKKHDINEFEQYAYNQEHKLISKSIRTYIIEQSPQIKNWDYISEDVEYLQQKYFDQKLISQSSPDKKKEGQDVIENFIYTSDKETRVNYLVNMRPGAYKKVFNMSQNDLFNDILGVLEETYASYKSSKLQDNMPNNENKSEEYYGHKDKNRTFKNNGELFEEPQKITSSIFHSPNNDKNTEQIQKKDLELSNNNYNDNNGFNSNNSNYKKYSNNQIFTNNPLSNLSNDKKPNYIDSKNSNISTVKDSYSTNNNYYKSNINMPNTYSQYKNNNKLSNTNSFISPSNNIQNIDNFKSNPKQYNIRQNYSNSNYNISNNYSRKDNDASSNSSFLNRKTNRVDSRSSSEARKDNNNSYYHKKENRNYSDYEERKYYKYYNKYDKDYDRYDKKERKNSPYKDYYYDDSSYNNNHSNDYSIKYSERDRDYERDRDRDRDRDRRDNDRDRDRNSWHRSNSESPKNKYQMNYKSNMPSSSIGNRYNGNNNNDYINDNNKTYGKDSYNYNSHIKDSYKDYRTYSQINKERDNYSNRNYINNDNKNINYNDNNRYSSKYYYDNGYYKKRFFNDNKYLDKRKSGYKGISSNFSGNKYSDRQEKSRSRSRNSRSRSRSWGRRSSHSRYRNREIIKRDHSNSNSVRKFNDNYE